MYTQQEVREIQDALSGKIKLSLKEIEAVKIEMLREKIPPHLWPFKDLFIANHQLYRKISEDDTVRKYSLFGFFPETFELVYGSEVSPEISFDGGNRGIVGIIKHPTKKIVIKPIQNSREPEVVQIAEELGVGPKQYASLDGFLTEEFVEGDLFSRLRGNKASADSMYDLGRRMGEILTKLHLREVYYNDTILTDDFGRSHVIVPGTSPAILFDYGVALRLNRHPNLTDEEIYNFARTLPIMNMYITPNPKEEHIRMVVKHFKPDLQRHTKGQIMARDVDFIKEGLWFAGARLSAHIAEPFWKGFQETYF